MNLCHLIGFFTYRLLLDPAQSVHLCLVEADWAFFQQVRDSLWFRLHSGMAATFFFLCVSRGFSWWGSLTFPTSTSQGLTVSSKRILTDPSPFFQSQQLTFVLFLQCNLNETTFYTSPSQKNGRPATSTSCLVPLVKHHLKPVMLCFCFLFF